MGKVLKGPQLYYKGVTTFIAVAILVWVIWHGDKLEVEAVAASAATVRGGVEGSPWPITRLRPVAVPGVTYYAQNDASGYFVTKRPAVRPTDDQRQLGPRAQVRGKSRLDLSDCPPVCPPPQPVCPPGCPPPPPPPPPCPSGCPSKCKNPSENNGKDCPSCPPPCQICCRPRPPPPVCLPGCEPCCWPPPPCPPHCPSKPLPKVLPFKPTENEKPKPCVPHEFPPPGSGMFGFRATDFRSGAAAFEKLLRQIQSGFGVPDLGEPKSCIESNYKKDDINRRNSLGARQDDVPVFVRFKRGANEVEQQDLIVPSLANGVDLDLSALDAGMQEQLARAVQAQNGDYQPEALMFGGAGDVPQGFFSQVRRSQVEKKVQQKQQQQQQQQNVEQQKPQLPASSQRHQQVAAAQSTDPADLLRQPGPSDKNPYRSGAKVVEYAGALMKTVKRRVENALYPFKDNEDKCKDLSGDQKKHCLMYAQ